MIVSSLAPEAHNHWHHRHHYHYHLHHHYHHHYHRRRHHHRCLRWHYHHHHYSMTGIIIRDSSPYASLHALHLSLLLTAPHTLTYCTPRCILLLVTYASNVKQNAYTIMYFRCVIYFRRMWKTDIRLWYLNVSPIKHKCKHVMYMFNENSCEFVWALS